MSLSESERETEQMLCQMMEKWERSEEGAAMCLLSKPSKTLKRPRIPTVAEVLMAPVPQAEAMLQVSVFFKLTCFHIA